MSDQTAAVAVELLPSWASRAMREARSLAAIRRAKGRVAPSDSDLAWVERVLVRVGLPGLPAPDAHLTYHPRQTVELIWAAPGIVVRLAPPMGLGWWPASGAARRLRRELRRAFPGA